MELKNLNTFIQVAEAGSFSRAADRLGYSQPTISVQIKQLEEELGFKLFDRIGHSVRLTDKGRDTLAHAQQIWHSCMEMTRQNRPASPAVIRLAMADSLCQPLMLQGFSRLRQDNPNIYLKVTTAGTGELLRLLDRNEADIVCTLDSHNYNTNYIIAAEEKVGVHFVASVQNPLAKLPYLSKEDLLNAQFLLTEKGMSYRRLLDEWLAEASLELQPSLELGSADLICTLVEKDVGISFLPDYVTADALKRGAVVRLDALDFHPALWKQLLYHRDKWVSSPMQTVLDHLATIPL